MSDAELPVAKRIWYRTTFFNATIVGLGALFAPGLYNAMASTGAGGAQTPYLVMRGNAILSCMIFFSCFTASIFANKFGLKWTFIVGTSGYAVYSASLYQNNRYGTEWFVLFGSAVCGLSAGLFWTAEAAIMVSYPEPWKRGRYLSMWLAYRNSGSILGGSINLAFNYSGKRTGSLNYRTFIVFVALQCLGPLVAAFLTPASNVQRTDGSKVESFVKRSTWEEIKAISKLFITRQSLMLIPICAYGTFPLSYVGSYLTLYFSVRSRALASLVSALVQILGNLVTGIFLDWRRLTMNQRARYAFVAIMALTGGTWIYTAIIQHDYSSTNPKLDWVDVGWARGWFLYILIQLNFALIYNYLFWIIGGLSTSANETVRWSALIRGVEAAGGAVAAGISSTHASLVVAMAVNFALWGVGVILAWPVIRKLGLDEDGQPIPEVTDPKYDLDNELEERTIGSQEKIDGEDRDTEANGSRIPSSR